jgi:predicted nuclease with RNAse H fold
MNWAGVDVGAGKGFDVAAISGTRLVAGPARIADVAGVVRWLREHEPIVVAVDSPRSAAPDGERSRHCERELVRAGICGIRYTPDAAALDRNQAHYAWIGHGLALYRALAKETWEVIECFPTATWSRLGGPRGRRSRTWWSAAVLASLGIDGLPPRMSQDARDAVGAAFTARLHSEGRTESFGEIVVPFVP